MGLMLDFMFISFLYLFPNDRCLNLEAFSFANQNDGQIVPLLQWILKHGVLGYKATDLASQTHPSGA